MTAPVVQRTRFKASPKRLYAIYMDAAQHGAVTGGKVVISETPGSRFSAFDGELSGATLHTIPGRLIVQRWRSSSWPKTDLDSILTLTFSKDGEDGVIDLVHANVPAHDREGVNQGWRNDYWKPLRAWLAGR